MNWQGPEFVIALVAISTFGWVATSWIRARHGYPVEGEWGGAVGKTDPQADRQIEAVARENAQLRVELGSLKDRLANVERIVTDDAHGLTREIEALGTRRVN